MSIKKSDLSAEDIAPQSLDELNIRFSDIVCRLPHEQKCKFVPSIEGTQCSCDVGGYIMDLYILCLSMLPAAQVDPTLN